jgi:hypothetical protein
MIGRTTPTLTRFGRPFQKQRLLDGQSQITVIYCLNKIATEVHISECSTNVPYSVAQKDHRACHSTATFDTQSCQGCCVASFRSKKREDPDEKASLFTSFNIIMRVGLSKSWVHFKTCVKLRGVALKGLKRRRQPQATVTRPI